MSTDPGRIQILFQAAAAMPDAAARKMFLEHACGNDVQLRAAVEALLQAHDRPESGSLPTEPMSSADASATEAFQPNGPDTTPIVSDGPETTAFDSQNPERAHERRADSQTPINPRAAATGVHSPNAVTPDREGFRSGVDAPLAAGQVIAGRYTLIRVIGEGGMGAVYLASQTEPIKRQVALKLIKGGMDSYAVLARFEAERQALALMDHPNIARVYDGGTTTMGQPFFVMELVHGEALTKYCDRHRLSLKARLNLFIGVCRAVQHAHQKGIIHRDLKPGNVLVTEVDGRPTPKVIDFGVAKATDVPASEDTFWNGDEIVGTPSYMSPEQANPSSVDIDTRTDVYALGVMLYELLTGYAPIDPREFRRGAVLEMLRMVREVDPPRPSTKISMVKDLPSIAANRAMEPRQLKNLLQGDIDFIVMKAIEKDRERRYNTANGLAEDVLRYLADEPVLARPPSQAYRLRKFVRRNRGSVVAAATIVLLLVAGIIGVTIQWREAIYQRIQAEAAQAAAETSSRVAQEQRKVALDAVGRMVTTVRTELGKKPDLQGVLKAVLQIAQESLDKIAQNPLVDISLNDTTRAATHNATARLYRDLGDTPTALKELTRANDIYQAILDKAAEGPDKEVVKKNLLIVLLTLGQTSLNTGAQADARGYYDRAAQLMKLVDQKTAEDYRKILISFYVNVGVVTGDTRPREARENYLGALRIADDVAEQETLAKGKPSDDIRLMIQELNWVLGGVEFRLRQLASAEQYLAKATTLATLLIAEDPGSNARKRLLAKTRERRGDELLRTNKPAESAKEWAAAVELYKAIADSDPKNVGAQADLARVLYSQGLASLRNKDTVAAAPYFQASLELRKKRVNLKTETVAQRDLMPSLARSGSHLEATDLAEAVRAKLPKDPGALLDVALCYAICSVAVPAAGADKEIHSRYVSKSLDALKQSIEAGYGDKVNLETEPDFDAIRNLPEFKKLVSGVVEP